MCILKIRFYIPQVFNSKKLFYKDYQLLNYLITSESGHLSLKYRLKALLFLIKTSHLNKSFYNYLAVEDVDRAPISHKLSPDILLVRTSAALTEIVQLRLLWWAVDLMIDPLHLLNLNLLYWLVDKLLNSKNTQMKE